MPAGFDAGQRAPIAEFLERAGAASVSGADRREVGTQIMADAGSRCAGIC